MKPVLHLAPLHGVTNRTFREAYFRHFSGFDAALAPFILAVRTSQAKPTHFKDLVPRAEGGIPLVPQLLGNDPLAFVETARVLAGEGYREINLNLGCPYPMVANKQRGSGLLPYPERIAKILDAACAETAFTVSVKLRLGRADPDDILKVLPVLNDHPLDRVIIHPRIGTQMYRGTVDLDGFACAAALCRHRVVYNGDITDTSSWETLRARFPAIGEWMIGRRAISNPFLPEEIQAAAGFQSSGGTVASGTALPLGAAAASPNDTESRLDRLQAFHDDLYASYRAILCGPAHVLDKMKEIWSYLGASFPRGKRELERVARAKTLAEYEAAVGALF